MSAHDRDKKTLQAKIDIKPMISTLIALITLIEIFIIVECQQQAHQNDALTSAVWLNQREPSHPPSERTATFLGRIGPNMRASANYHDYLDVGLNESIEAWQLMREQVKLIAQDQVSLHGKQIKSILRDANVSRECQESAQHTLNSMRQLDTWAIEMWSATSSFPPVGLVDGHVTDVGSYRGCVDVSVEKNSHFNYTNYCLLAFRPLIPAKPRFHSVFKRLPEQFVGQFNETDFVHTLAIRAQYFYYLYRKTGICVPYSCTPGDIQQIAGLIARRLAIMAGPVKCYTKAPAEVHELNTLESNFSQAIKPYLRHEEDEIQFGSIEADPILIQLQRPLNRKQIVSLAIIGSFFALVFLSTIWHILELTIIKLNRSPENEADMDEAEQSKSVFGNNSHHLNCGTNFSQSTTPAPTPDPKRKQESTLINRSHGTKYVAFYYFSIITNAQEFLNTSLRSNEIRCLHGFRVLTMFWIICVHTMQYNEWSGFTRVFESETSLTDPMMQPMINANYVVDNFFLMSGLLAAYTTWFTNKGTAINFSISTSLLGRYLRLTPQALLVSLLYILLPLAGDGPFWYDMTHDAAKNCEKNWWVNMFHMQAFYRDEEMCNLVGWWISVDMFYYLVAIVLLGWILRGNLSRAFICTLVFVVYCTGAAAVRHYLGGFTPNNLGNVPQVNEVWSEYVVLFNWSPYPHAYVFFLGLWIGYALANNKWKYVIQKWSSIGWILSVSTLILVNVSSHIWISGAIEPNNQIISTSYNIICSIIWANAFGWIIAALHYGSMPKVSSMLSTDFCVLLSKASFIIYLSHMLLVRIVFGGRYQTLEVSPGMLIYVMIGNIVSSVIFGVFLCITFEGPCMKFQRWIISKVKPTRRLPVAGANYSAAQANHDNDQQDKMSLSLSPTTMVLLK